MPRFHILLIFFLLTTAVFGVSAAESSSQLVVFTDPSVANHFISSDQQLAIDLPIAALASYTRLGVYAISSAGMSDAISDIYTWQILDTLLVAPMTVSLQVSDSDLPVKRVLVRTNKENTWQPVSAHLNGDRMEFETSELYGQVVVTAQAAEAVSLDLDEMTVSRGYPVTTPDDLFNFHIIADAITEPVTVAITPLFSGVYVAPEGLNLVSPVYHFKISGSEALSVVKDLAIDMRYEDTETTKSIYYWNNIENIWEHSPSWLRTGEGKIRTFTHQNELIVAVMADDIMSEGVASWYRYKHGNFAASPDYAKGTKLLVTNSENGKSVVVEVNDYGPDRSIHPDRVIDLDYEAFKQIASPSLGLINVVVETYYE